MTVIVGLLIGNETWRLMERSLRSLRAVHPDQDVIIYYSLESTEQEIVESLEGFGVEAVDIGRPGLMGVLSAESYSNYNTAEFNIKTSFKWLAILAAMTSRLDNVIFIDADIKIASPLPFDVFAEIWQHYDIFVQDEGNNILPKHPCTGFIGFKFGDANVSLLEALHREHCAAIVSADSQHDQSIFYGYISRNIEVYKRIYFLPQMLFPVGYLGPVFSRFSGDTGLLNDPGDPIIYHANWAVGSEAKAALMDGFRDPAPAGISEGDACVDYDVGRYQIQLPIDHLLPVYQANHPCYDRFLLCLAGVVPAGTAVIDVGANCGDTLAAMASANAEVHFLCIEADRGFFTFLETNAQAIMEASPGLRVDLICALVGSRLEHAVMEGIGGTKKASITTDQQQALAAESLDSIVLRTLEQDEAVSVLKIDTDGWDYDVIASASATIRKHLPLLFFECQHGSDEELDGYLKAMDWLSDVGYCHWFLFDNYGNHLLEVRDVAAVKSLLYYVHRQNAGLATRTMHYLDVLAVTPGRRDLAAASLEAYVAACAASPAPAGSSR